MPDQVKKFVDPIKTRWLSLNTTQKYRLAGVVAFLLVAISFTLYFALRTRYEYLANNRDMLEIATMQVALNQAGIRNRHRNHGTALQVDSRRMQEAMQVIVVQQAAPVDERFRWANALDTGLGTTDLERRRMHQLAMEDDIAQMMVGMLGISHALVNLDLPHRRPFDTNAPEPSVTIFVTTTRDIGPHEARTLALIPVRSISGLNLENVMIADQHMRTLFDGDRDVNLGDPLSSAHEARQMHHNRVEWTLGRQFLHLFDMVTPSVNSVFDDTLFREEVSSIWMAPEGGEGGIPFQARDVRADVENVPGGFEPGTVPNALVLPGYAMGPGGVMTASTRESDRQYHVDNIQIVTQTAPGWVDADNSFASITATRINTIRQDLWMADAPEGEARTAQDWERFKQENARTRVITSEFEYFDEILRMAALTTGLPLSNITLMILEEPNFIDIIPTDWDIPLLAMLAVLFFLIALLAIGLLQKAKSAAAASEDAEPELSVEDLLVSTQLEEAKEEAADEYEAIDYFKENEIKKHIEKFVNEKPEAVAALLRNWINAEEW